MESLTHGDGVTANTYGVGIMAKEKTTHHRDSDGQRLVTRTTKYENGKGKSVTRKPDGLFTSGDIVSIKKW